MGSCISKCSLSTSSPIHPNPPQDKLIISQSSTPPVPNHSSISSSQNSTAISHSSSSSKTKPIYSRGSISSPMKNRHIIILDPHKVTNPPIQGPCMLPFPKQQPQAAANARPFPLKRERSSSPPPCPRQKSFRGEPKLPPAAPPARRTSNSPSQARVMKAMVPPSNLVKCGPTIVGRGKVAMRRVHLVHSQQGNGGRMEDMDNPLISMECFIFL